jgi:hypothetical protein
VLDGLIERAGLAVTTDVAVEWVSEADGGVTVTVCPNAGERRQLRARQFICALPAQVALHILDVPDWKREALSSASDARRRALGRPRPYDRDRGGAAVGVPAPRVRRANEVGRGAPVAAWNPHLLPREDRKRQGDQRTGGADPFLRGLLQ